MNTDYKLDDGDEQGTEEMHGSHDAYAISIIAAVDNSFFNGYFIMFFLIRMTL